MLMMMECPCFGTCCCIASLGTSCLADRSFRATRNPFQPRVGRLQITFAVCAQAHNRGRKHKRRVEVAGTRAPRPSAHHCVICDITTTSAQHMAMHVAGKAHRRRVATGHMPASVAAAAAAGGPGAEPGATAADGSSGYDSGDGGCSGGFGARGAAAAAAAGCTPGGAPAAYPGEGTHGGMHAGAARPPSADSGGSGNGAGRGGFHCQPCGVAADSREAWSAHCETQAHRLAPIYHPLLVFTLLVHFATAVMLGTRAARARRMGAPPIACFCLFLCSPFRSLTLHGTK